MLLRAMMSNLLLLLMQNKINIELEIAMAMGDTRRNV